MSFLEFHFCKSLFLPTYRLFRGHLYCGPTLLFFFSSLSKKWVGIWFCSVWYLPTQWTASTRLGYTTSHYLVHDSVPTKNKRYSWSLHNFLHIHITILTAITGLKPIPVTHMNTWILYWKRRVWPQGCLHSKRLCWYRTGDSSLKVSSFTAELSMDLFLRQFLTFSRPEAFAFSGQRCVSLCRKSDG